MTPAQLEVLIALHETGNFTSAALRLGITQSGVSHAIRVLETSLGVKLVDRHKSPQILTDIGQRLLPHARGVLAQSEALRQEANAAKGYATGTLRIGSFGPTSSVQILPKLLHAFSNRYPGIDVYVEEAPDEVIDQWLIDRRIEIGFVTAPDDRFDTIPIAQDEFVVLIPELHALAHHNEITPSNLSGCPFIMTKAGSNTEVQAWLTVNKTKPKILFHITQIISILGVVQSGLALSIVARLSLPNHYPGVIYRPLNPRAPRKVALAVKNKNDLSPIARVFWDMAIKLTNA